MIKKTKNILVFHGFALTCPNMFKTMTHVRLKWVKNLFIHPSFAWSCTFNPLTDGSTSTLWKRLHAWPASEACVTSCKFISLLRSGELAIKRVAWYKTVPVDHTVSLYYLQRDWRDACKRLFISSLSFQIKRNNPSYSGVIWPDAKPSYCYEPEVDYFPYLLSRSVLFRLYLGDLPTITISHILMNMSCFWTI